MSGERPGPPQRVPTLTEVVALPDAPAPDAALPEAPVAAVEFSSALPAEEQITRQVLADLQRQIDLLLDYRLREMLAPLLARATDGLIRDARTELASTLRDVVARAVAQEISRHRAR
jgi:hypothetical protein